MTPKRRGSLCVDEFAEYCHHDTFVLTFCTTDMLLWLLAVGSVLGRIDIESVEGGRRNFSLADGSVAQFYYTRTCLPSPRCVSSVEVDALAPMTTAESVQVLHTTCDSCDRHTVYDVMHYHHSSFAFVFNTPVMASEIVLVSRNNLRVVDVALRSCEESVRPVVGKCVRLPITQRHSFIHHVGGDRRVEDNEVSTTFPLFDGIDKQLTHSDYSIDKKTGHKMRSHKSYKVRKIRAEADAIEDLIDRNKRQLSGRLSRDTTLFLLGSPYVITSDIIVPIGVTLIIQPGVRIQFASNIQLRVEGRLLAEGTVQQPIHLVSLDETMPWSGVTIDESREHSATRLISTVSRREGYLQSYDGGTLLWHNVCAQRWTLRNAHVVCRSHGYRLGAVITPSNTMEPPPDWMLSSLSTVTRQMTNVTCLGNEASLGDCAFDVLQTGQLCPTRNPPYITCQGSAPTMDDESTQSRFKYVNISHTLTGLTIKADRLPAVDYVIVRRSAGNGLTITTRHSQSYTHVKTTFHRLQLVSNTGRGLDIDMAYPYARGDIIQQTDRFHDVPQILFNETIIMNNGAEGVSLQGYGTLGMYASSLYLNGRHGLAANMLGGRIVLDTVLVDNNQLSGVNVVTTGNDGGSHSMHVDMHKANVTGHGRAAAVALMVEGVDHFSYLMDDGRVVDNNQGALFMKLNPKISANITLRRNEFTRNRGSIADVTSESGESTMVFDDNTATLNILSNHSTPQSIINIRLFHQSNTIQLINNRISKNTMHSVIVVEGSAESTENRVLVNNNQIIDNLAPVNVETNLQMLNMSGNTLVNEAATCEVMLADPEGGRPLIAVNLASNWWGDQIAPLTRVCDRTTIQAPGAVVITPVLSIDPFITILVGTTTSWTPTLIPIVRPLLPSLPQGFETAPLIADDTQGLIEGRTVVMEGSIVYATRYPIIVGEGGVLHVRAGSQLVFRSGTSLRVRGGQLLAEGTYTQPITFTSAGGNTWDGVVVDSSPKRRTTILQHVHIDNAVDGLSIDSEKIFLGNVSVRQPIRDGVYIGPNSATTVNLNDTLIINSRGSGITVGGRSTPIFISNAVIHGSRGDGVQFEGPVGSTVQLQRLTVTESGDYGIRFGSLSVTNVDVDGVTLSDQTRGRAAMQMQIRQYDLNCHFARNRVPSLESSLQCDNNQAERAGRMELSHNVFEENLNVVATVSLLHCTNAQIVNNTFSNNNYNFEHGVLKVVVEPAARQASNFQVAVQANKFVKNSGNYCIYLLPMTMHPLNATINANVLLENKNEQAAMIIGTPFVNVTYNQFVNPAHSYDVEVEYNDDRVLQATRNYWNTDISSEVAMRIRDYVDIPQRDVVNYMPFLTSEWLGGPTTEAPIVCEDNCNQNGQCVGPNQCSCDDGWSGNSCTTPICRQQCLNGGQCTAPNRCTCQSGWAGLDCGRPSCRDNCNNRGTCIDIDECRCDADWSGPTCEVRSTCDPPCQHGVCQRGECVCDRGWLPPQCIIADCSPIGGCKNGGQCTSPSACACPRGWLGLDCSLCQTGVNPQCTVILPETTTPPNINSVTTTRTNAVVTTSRSPPTGGRVGAESGRTCSSITCVYGTCQGDFCQCPREYSGTLCNVCNNCGPTIDFLYPMSLPSNSFGPINVTAFSIDLDNNKDYICSWSDRQPTVAIHTNDGLVCQLAQIPTSPTILPLSILVDNKPLVTSSGVILPLTSHPSCASQSCDTFPHYSNACMQGVCMCTYGACRGGVDNSTYRLPPIVDSSVPTDIREGVRFEWNLNQLFGSAQTSVFWRLLTAPDGMTLSSDGLLEWPNPVATGKQTEFTVSAITSAQESQFKLTLPLQPSYTPELVFDGDQLDVMPTKSIPLSINVEPSTTKFPLPVAVTLFDVRNNEVLWRREFKLFSTQSTITMIWPANITYAPGNARLSVTHPAVSPITDNAVTVQMSSHMSMHSTPTFTRQSPFVLTYNVGNSQQSGRDLTITILHDGPNSGQCDTLRLIAPTRHIFADAVTAVVVEKEYTGTMRVQVREDSIEWPHENATFYVVCGRSDANDVFLAVPYKIVFDRPFLLPHASLPIDVNYSNEDKTVLKEITFTNVGNGPTGRLAFSSDNTAVFVQSAGGRHPLHSTFMLPGEVRTIVIGLLPTHFDETNANIFIIDSDKSSANDRVPLNIQLMTVPSELTVYAFDELFWKNGGDVYTAELTAILTCDDQSMTGVLVSGVHKFSPTPRGRCRLTVTGKDYIDHYQWITLPRTPPNVHVFMMHKSDMFEINVDVDDNVGYTVITTDMATNWDDRLIVRDRVITVPQHSALTRTVDSVRRYVTVVNKGTLVYTIDPFDLLLNCGRVNRIRTVHPNVITLGPGDETSLSLEVYLSAVSSLSTDCDMQRVPIEYRQLNNVWNELDDVEDREGNSAFVTQRVDLIIALDHYYTAPTSVFDQFPSKSLPHPPVNHITHLSGSSGASKLAECRRAFTFHEPCGEMFSIVEKTTAGEALLHAILQMENICRLKYDIHVMNDVASVRCLQDAQSVCSDTATTQPPVAVLTPQSNAFLKVIDTFFQLQARLSDGYQLARVSEWRRFAATISDTSVDGNFMTGDELGTLLNPSQPNTVHNLFAAGKKWNQTVTEWTSSGLMPKLVQLQRVVMALRELTPPSTSPFTYLDSIFDRQPILPVSHVQTPTASVNVDHSSHDAHMTTMNSFVFTVVVDNHEGDRVVTVNELDVEFEPIDQSDVVEFVVGTPTVDGTSAPLPTLPIGSSSVIAYTVGLTAKETVKEILSYRIVCRLHMDGQVYRLRTPTFNVHPVGRVSIRAVIETNGMGMTLTAINDGYADVEDVRFGNIQPYVMDLRTKKATAYHVNSAENLPFILKSGTKYSQFFNITSRNDIQIVDPTLASLSFILHGPDDQPIPIHDTVAYRLISQLNATHKLLVELAPPWSEYELEDGRGELTEIENIVFDPLEEGVRVEDEGELPFLRYRYRPQTSGGPFIAEISLPSSTIPTHVVISSTKVLASGRRVDVTDTTWLDRDPSRREDEQLIIFDKHTDSSSIYDIDIGIPRVTEPRPMSNDGNTVSFTLDGTVSGTSVGRVKLDNNGGEFVFKLYGGGGTYSIDQNTGEIMVRQTVTPAQSQCVYVTLTNTAQQTVAIPVRIAIQGDVSLKCDTVPPNVESMIAWIHVREEPTTLSTSTSTALSSTSPSTSQQTTPSTPTTTLIGQTTQFIDEETLVQMACRLRDTKSIYGVICDLNKAVPTF